MMQLPSIPSALKSRPRFTRFLLVGGIGFMVDQLVLISLVELTGLTLELAKLASAEAAIVVMFIVNDRWTFSAWGGTGIREQLIRLLKSNLVRVGGITVAVVVLSLLVRYAGIPYPIANAIGIVCGFFVNYTFETLYTWRIGRR